MARIDRRRFLEVASATGVAAAVSPGAALARGIDERKPNLVAAAGPVLDKSQPKES